jgi:hypothetical protein
VISSAQFSSGQKNSLKISIDVNRVIANVKTALVGKIVDLNANVFRKEFYSE